MEPYYKNTTRKRHPIYSGLSKRVLDGEKIKVALFQFSKLCPYECIYCYRGSGKKGQIVPFPIVEKIFNQLNSDGWETFPVISELVPVVEPYLVFFKKYGVTEMSTTGLPLLNEFGWYDKLLQSNIDGLRITVFPTNGLHKFYTHQNREDVIRAIRLSLEKDFHVSWNFLLNRETLPYLVPQLEEAIKTGVNRFHINMFFSGGRGAGIADGLLTTEEVAQAVLLFEDLYRQYKQDIEITRNGLMGPSNNTRSQSARLADGNTFCLAGIGNHGKMIYIDADLKVYGCMTQLGDDLCIGSVTEEGEIKMNGKDPLKGYDRKNCFRVNHCRQKCM
jgi:MoaA/NifB/PqqE/SkfB family radical SAM enzyme